MVNNKYKCLSHIERMNDDRIKPDCSMKPFECYEFVNTQVINEKTGRVCSQIIKRLVEKNRYKAFKVSDFSMENLQAIGADKNLKTLSISPDSHSAITSVEKSIIAIAQSEKKQ